MGFQIKGVKLFLIFNFSVVVKNFKNIIFPNLI